MLYIDFSQISLLVLCWGCSALPSITQSPRAKLPWFKTQELLHSLLSTFFPNIPGVSFATLGCKCSWAPPQCKSHQPALSRPCSWILRLGSLLAQEQQHFPGPLLLQWAAIPPRALLGLFWPLQTRHWRGNSLSVDFQHNRWLGTFISNKKQKGLFQLTEPTSGSPVPLKTSQRSPLPAYFW